MSANTSIVQLFGYLNREEGTSIPDKLLYKCKTLEDIKLFGDIPKDMLDYLICLYGLGNSMDIVEYLKSLGGSDEFYHKCKKWMDDMFKDLKKFTHIVNDNLLYYGSDKDNIVLRIDTEKGRCNIHFIRVYQSFKSDLGSYITTFERDDIMEIFQAYLLNHLRLGTQIDKYNHFSVNHIADQLVLIN